LVTVAEVRTYLNDLPAEMVADTVVQSQINIADTIIEMETSGRVTITDKERAKLAMAGYLTYLAYATYVERGTGEVPAPILTHLTELKAVADRLVEYVRRGRPTIEPKVSLTESTWEQVKKDA